jgi:hypothetical protein
MTGSTVNYSIMLRLPDGLAEDAEAIPTAAEFMWGNFLDSIGKARAIGPIYVTIARDVIHHAEVMRIAGPVTEKEATEP